MERVTKLLSQLSSDTSCTIDGSAVTLSNPLNEFINRILGTPGIPQADNLVDSRMRTNEALYKLNVMEMSMKLTPEQIMMKNELRKSKDKMDRIWNQCQKNPKAKMELQIMENAWRENLRSVQPEFKSLKRAKKIEEINYKRYIVNLKRNFKINEKDAERIVRYITLDYGIIPGEDVIYDYIYPNGVKKFLKEVVIPKEKLSPEYLNIPIIDIVKMILEKKYNEFRNIIKSKGDISAEDADLLLSHIGFYARTGYFMHETELTESEILAPHINAYEEIGSSDFLTDRIIEIYNRRTGIDIKNIYSKKLKSNEPYYEYLTPKIIKEVLKPLKLTETVLKLKEKPILTKSETSQYIESIVDLYKFVFEDSDSGFFVSPKLVEKHYKILNKLKKTKNLKYIDDLEESLSNIYKYIETRNAGVVDHLGLELYEVVATPLGYYIQLLKKLRKPTSKL